VNSLMVTPFTELRLILLKCDVYDNAVDSIATQINYFRKKANIATILQDDAAGKGSKLILAACI
jgi:hypothetical protein